MMRKESITPAGCAPNLSRIARPSHWAILALALVLGICSHSIRLFAQCTNAGSYDNYQCNRQTRTYYSTPLVCNSGHCRYDFSWTTGVYTLVSRTPTTVTLRIGDVAPSYAQVIVTMYDSVNNCSAFMDWTDRFKQWTFPDISGTIPACPTVGQTYTYLLPRYGNSGGFFPTETMVYSIQGGTILSTTTTVPNSTYVTDTIKVNWNAAGPHRLIATQYGSTFQLNCTYADTLYDGNGTLPVIQGPSALCGTTTGNYTSGALDPAFTYTWSASNGTITSGQGTQNVTVNWTSSGVLTLTQTAVPCGWTRTFTKNVTVSASPPPAPTLAPSYTGCSGQPLTLNGGVFSSYLWSNAYSTQTINVTTAGTYTLTVTNAAGCTGTASTNVTFNASPTPSLGPNQTLCSGTPVTLNPGTFTSYAWNTGATTQTISPTTSGTYTVTVTNASGCSASASKNLTFTPLPAPSLGPNQTVCAGTPVTLNPGTFTTYAWSTGATTQTISPTVSGTYTVTVTNASGCSNSSSVTLTFNPPPAPSLGPNQTVCAGTPVTLNPGTFASYAWSTGATTQTISPTATGTYSVTVTDAIGCTGNSSVTVTFTPLPAPNLGPNQSLCAGTPVTLNPGTFATYAWSTGATTQTISPTTSGTYSVTVTDANGCTASSSVTLTFNALPSPNLGANQSVCAGAPLTLNPGTFLSYAWSTGATTPTISPSTTGTYSVTVTDANGCTGNSSVNITFLPAPTPNLGPNTSFCSASGFTLNAGSGASWSWSTGATTQTIQPSASGTYTVTVTNANGCTGNSSVTLTMLASPTPTISGPSFACPGSNVTLSANPGYIAYLWSTGATTPSIIASLPGTYGLSVTATNGCSGATSINFSNFPAPTPNLGPNQTVCAGTPVTLNPGSFSSYVWSTGATTPTLSVSTTGTYSVTVTNASGCTASSSVSVTVNPAPSPNLGPNQTVCTGTPVTLNPGSFSSYAWNTGATTASISPTTSGTYTVTVTNASGCTNSASVTVTFNALPTPNLGPNQTGCVGTPIVLNPGSFTSYSWNTGATSSTFAAIASGTYTVTVTNPIGCSASSSVTLTMNPLPFFSLGNDTIICADTTIVLTGPSGMSSYAWSTSATSSNTTINAGGTYSLTVTDANGCSANDAILIQGLTDCVFPGDANYDGVADNQDILSIGAYYGRSNGPRANATTQWYGQSTPDWGSPLPGQADPKHSDCDGDGAVAALDTNVVHLNYGQTHSKNTGAATAGAQLRVIALQDSILPGTLARFVVMLGDIGLQVDSVYGLAFTVNYTAGPTVAPGIHDINWSTCWFAPVGLQLPFQHLLPGSASGEVAIVRNDQQQQLGYGEVCRFSILTDSNLVPTNASLAVWLTGVHLVNAELGPQVVEAFGDSVVVSRLLTATAAAISTAPPRIYPNPAADEVYVVQENASLYQVEVYALSGNRVQLAVGDGSPRMAVSLQGLVPGMYLVRTTSSVGTSVQKLAVER